MAPAPDSKVGPNGVVDVRIRVLGLEAGEWVLTLDGPSGAKQLLAQGAGDRDDFVVARVYANSLVAGASYRLALQQDEVAGAEMTFRVTDPKFQAIPIDSGNFSQEVYSFGWSVDASGTVLGLGGRTQDDTIIFFNTDTWERNTFPFERGNSEGGKLARDGKRYFSYASFPPPAGDGSLGLGFINSETGQLTLVDSNGLFLFDVSVDGNRAVYQGLVPNPSGAGFTRQYFLWDEGRSERRQLTSAADAIVYPSDSEACPRLLGTTPVMSADGSRAVFFTHSTLGNAADDPTIGCRVFIYDVADDTLALAAAIPREKALGLPSLSADGRWLAFTSAYIRPPHTAAGSYAALLDLETGALTDPVGGIVDSPSFDSVITGDRDAVVVSTTADLDPRVGNADHNFELFLYDNASGEFTQISETTGGAGLGGNGCQQRRPAVDHDGSVVVWAWDRMSAESCVIDGPQRNEADGLHLGRVRAIRKRPGNHAPEWSLPRTARVRAGDTLDLDVSASDADGDFLTFFAQVPDTVDVPAGSTFTDHRNGTATLHWPTNPADAGVHTLRVAVFDEGGDEQFGDVQIAVCSEILHDGNLLGVLWALFDPDPPVPCRDADLNGDGVVSGADLLVAALRAG